MPVDPQARALLELMAERQIPPMHTLAPDEARRLYRERRFFTQPEPRAMDVRDRRVDVPGGTTLALRVYRPPGLEADAPAPALVYLHGGGWVIGDLDTHDVLCRDLAAGAGCVVVAVDYRLAPEHRFPAAFDDALAALRHVRAHAHDFGVDPARLAVGGDSAGGNLAAAACLALRDAGEPAPAFQLLIYPATDMHADAPSHAENGHGLLLTRETIAYYRGHYVDEPSWGDWRASPLRHGRFDALPPALVVVAGFDPLRDEGRAYAQALSDAGVRAQLVAFERQIHGFITMGRVLDEARSAVALCAGALRDALAAASPPPAASRFTGA